MTSHTSPATRCPACGRHAYRRRTTAAIRTFPLLDLIDQLKALVPPPAPSAPPPPRFHLSLAREARRCGDLALAEQHEVDAMLAARAARASGGAEVRR